MQKDSKEKHSLKEFDGYVNKRVDYDFKPPFLGKFLTYLRKKSPTSKREGAYAPVKVGDEFW
ncbi:hypothetical protein [Ureibacillus thermosphaericus]|uniref:hypothetical protein n=1 Tax=Ureibacillus thermosphaericus TaxID=51173 RepID=UPI0030C8FF73